MFWYLNSIYILEKMDGLKAKNMLYKLSVFIQYTAVFSQIANERTVQDYACFGSGFHSLIDFNCSSSENIFPLEVSVGAKNSTLSCPDAMEATATSDIIQQCCFPNTAEDCISSFYTLDNSSASPYYETCVGMETCQSLQARRIGVPCNSTGYLLFTNYMFMDYYCIKVSNIARFPTAALQNDGSGSFLYLQGSTYPARVATTSITCSAETDCMSTIDVYGLHVDFELELDNITCKQSISIDEEGSTVYIVNCTNNDKDTGYRIRTFVTSNTNYITLNYTSSVSNSGQFWLGLKATGNLTLDCPSKDRANECLTTNMTSTTEMTTMSSTTEMTTESSTTMTTMSSTTDMTTESSTTMTTTSSTTKMATDSSTTMTTESSTEMTTGLSTNVTTEPSSNPATTHRDPNSEESKYRNDSNDTLIIVVSICGVLSVVTISIVVICCRYKKKKNGKDGETIVDDNVENYPEHKVIPYTQNEKYDGIPENLTKPSEAHEIITKQEVVPQRLSPLTSDRKTPEQESGIVDKPETEVERVDGRAGPSHKKKKKKREKNTQIEKHEVNTDESYKDDSPKTDEKVKELVIFYPLNVPYKVLSLSGEPKILPLKKDKKKEEKQLLNDDEDKYDNAYLPETQYTWPRRLYNITERLAMETSDKIQQDFNPIYMMNIPYQRAKTNILQEKKYMKKSEKQRRNEDGNKFDYNHLSEAQPRRYNVTERLAKEANSRILPNEQNTSCG